MLIYWRLNNPPPKKARVNMLIYQRVNSVLLPQDGDFKGDYDDETFTDVTLW